MSGESYPENSFELYDQLIQWIESYLTTSEHSLTLELHLNYLNTSSVRFMVDIFDMLQSAFENNKEVLSSVDGTRSGGEMAQREIQPC